MSEIDDSNVDMDLLGAILDGSDTNESDKSDSDADKKVNDVNGDEYEPIADYNTVHTSIVKDNFSSDKDSDNDEKDDSSFEEDEELPFEPERSATISSRNSANDIVCIEATNAIDEESQTHPVTVITEGTTINGSISAEGAMEINGTVNGNVDSKGVLYVQGVVKGDVKADKLYVNTPRIEGNLTSVTDIKVSQDTVVIGDVKGSLAYVAGAVKGNIDVNGVVEVASTAIVKGDIIAKSIQVNNGAVVDGHFSLNYADIGNIDEFFSDGKSSNDNKQNNNSNNNNNNQKHNNKNRR